MAVLWLVLSLMVAAALWRNENFFLRDDFLNYYLGGYAEAVRAFKAFEIPLLTPTSWRVGALGGEYQFGIFSPVLGAVNLVLFSFDLPLHRIAAALVWIHILILGTGAYVLARSRQLATELSLMVALVASLNGWIVIWGVNWFAALAAFAWIPWAWWATEQATERGGDRRYILAAGFFIALVFVAGFPYACLMACVVAAAVAGRPLLAGRFREALPAALALAIGIGLSAPSWLLLVEYSGATLRSQSTQPMIFQTDLLVPFKAWFGTLLPTLKAPWFAPWLPPAKNTISLVMHVGLVPVVVLVAAGLALRSRLVREHDYDFLVLAILFLLVTLPSIGVLRWSFRWLPLFFLHLALVAACAATSLRCERQRPTYGKVAWVLIAATAAYAWFIDGDHKARSFRLMVAFLVLASLWWALESFRGPKVLKRQLLWLIVPVSSLLAYGIVLKNLPPYERRVVPRASSAFDPSVTYLALYSMDDTLGKLREYSGDRYFPGNEQMHPGLRLVNGYSPLGPAGVSWTFGFNYIGALQDSAPSVAFGPLLRRMAVDGLVVWPDSLELREVPLEEFEQVASMPEADVYHRRGGPTPRVQAVRRALLASSPEKIWERERTHLPLLDTPGQSVAEAREVEFGDGEITLIEEGRHHVEAEVEARPGERPVLVVFARPWFPGYRVEVDGEAAPLRRLDVLQPAVEVPAGRVSRVRLVYRPWSWVAGVALFVASLVGAVGLVVAPARRPTNKTRTPRPPTKASPAGDDRTPGAQSM